MRKFLIVSLLGMIMLFVGCDKFRGAVNNYDSADSAQVAEFVNSTTNPQLMSVEEVLSLKQSMLEKQSVDSAFLALDNSLIETVSTVLLKKKRTITKKDIIEEYRQHDGVYNNLPKSSTTQKIDTNATDLGTRQNSGTSISTNNNNGNIISRSYSFRTDTVDGKPLKVRIEKIESYE